MHRRAASAATVTTASMALAVLLAGTGTLALDNGFVKPPLGWSALYGAPFSSVNETKVRIAAEGLVAGGFKDVGYSYVNLDDWYAERGPDGRIRGTNNTFPHGLRATSDAIHALGLKFGVYTAASQRTCGNYSASMYNERLDADTFANDWQIDMLKDDSCLYNGGTASRPRYVAMRDALNATGRPIFFSVEGQASFPDVANMWRSGGDIWPKWDECILRNLYANNALAALQEVGAYNDPDMIQSSSPDLTFDEAQSQFVLWAVMKAPLILGTLYDELATMREDAPDRYALLTNPEIIAIDQDASPQATLRCSTPSMAQQAAGSRGVNVTLQDCDARRCDQQFVVGGGDTRGSGGAVADVAALGGRPSASAAIQSAHGNLCLDSAEDVLYAKPCDTTAQSQQWPGAARDSQFRVLRTSGGQCLQNNASLFGGTQAGLVTKPCMYNGALPPPLQLEFASQEYVWDQRDGMLIHGSTGLCATLGNPQVVPQGQPYVTNNFTLEHEVWAGPLSTPNQWAVVLFNKGLTNETLKASWDLLDGVAGGASATLPVRDVLARKDLGPTKDGVSAVVPSHGVALYVVG